MELVIVRHGQSKINHMYHTLPIYCGRYNTPLTETGRQSAKNLQQHPHIQKIETVYASDLKRAIETARLAKPNKTIEIRKELTERSLGIFEGKTIEEIKQKYPEYFEKKELMNFRFDMEVRVPGGENYADVCKRAKDFLSSLDLKQNTTIGIFSHFSFIRCLLYVALGLSQEELYQLEIPNCKPIIITAEQIENFQLIEPKSIEELYVHT